MRVDVLISGLAPGDERNTGTRVRTLLQNIEVLSAGKNFQRDTEGKPVEVPVVNLLVTPEQAEVLSLASNQTHIQLVLRNPLDHQLATPPGTDLAVLFGHEKPKPAPVVRRAAAPAPAPPPQPAPAKPAAPVMRVVQITNGAKHTEQTFAIPGEAN
jgi:pilus assembly protein CpaB